MTQEQTRITPDVESLKGRFGRDMFNDFDIDDPKFNEHFFDILDEMVAKCPVVRSNVGNGYWMVTNQEGVRKVGQDWRTFSSAKGYMPNRPEGLPYLMPEESDPPKHTAWRKVLNPYLSPTTVARYEDQIRTDVNTLIDRFIDKGECEFVSEFGSKLPGWAFFKNVLGVPIDDLDMLVNSVEKGTFAPPEERPGHMAKVFEYLGEYLEIRKDQPPRGDLVDVIAAGVEYDDGQPAPWEDRVSILVDLTFGGIATTTYVMASAIHHLATHQDDREALVDNPDMIERAVEEFVRVFPPVVALGRTCTRDTEVAGTPMKEGDFVLLGYSAASRDPRVVENPSKIDITRQAVLHTAFGVGQHRCIGSNLARLELRATVDEWLKRIPDFGIKPGTQPSYETGILRTMKDLHLVF
ncbi:cytochrome P450 [Rhodococcus zopfii]|uniref:Cytochrome P450 n=1 Tax=Rhodococcus zopfii TaxID=43772 RepID=A0ABU3WUA2_9NOCA|nr:cytochrome P450 [Rhodococcus zopfii]